MFPKIGLPSLKLTANAPENKPKPNRKVVFQPSIFRGELLVSGKVPQNGWFISENHLRINNLVVLLFLETPLK